MTSTEISQAIDRVRHDDYGLDLDLERTAAMLEIALQLAGMNERAERAEAREIEKQATLKAMAPAFTGGCCL